MRFLPAALSLATVALLVGAGCGPAMGRDRPARTVVPLRAEQVSARARPPVHRRAARTHPVLVWTYGDDARRPGMISAIEALGATGLSMPLERDLARFVRSGQDWYEDDAAGKGELHLKRELWKRHWDRVWSERTTAWPLETVRSRPHCLRAPEVRAQMIGRAVQSAARGARRAGGKGGAVAISLADEPSMTVRANPLDWCLCHLCCVEFKDRMQLHWEGDLDALNDAWGTEYRTWGAVRPWTTAAIRDRCLTQPPHTWNLAPWIQTRAFQDATFSETLAALREVVSAVGPGVPCGITGTQAPSAFGGWDYRGLTAACDFLEPYDIGLAVPVARDLGGDGLLLGQTVFPSSTEPLLPMWRVWRGLARGVGMSIVWSSKDAVKFSEAEGVAPTLSRYGTKIAPVLAEISAKDGVGARLAQARPFYDDTRIVISQPSLAIRWMLDSQDDGDTWLRRFGSYEADNSQAIQSRAAAWRALAGRSPKFIDERDLARPGALQGVKLLVLPDVMALSDDTCSVLRRWSRHGGRMVSDIQPGAYDEIGAPRGRAAERMGGRVVVDPGFERLGQIARETCGERRLQVSATLVGSGEEVPVELGVRVDGDRFYVVAVPDWNVTIGTGGEARARLPKEPVHFAFWFSDGGDRVVRNERANQDLGPVNEWDIETDAAGGAVFSWTE